MPTFDIVKLHKPLYAPSAKHPAIVEVPDLAFLMVDGRGDPGSSEAFENAMQALFSAAYTLKFSLKKADPERDFKVAPVEGLWWGDDPKPSLADLQRDRDRWNWTLMMAVPDTVKADEVAAALEAAARKKDLPAAPLLRLERFEEGLAAQILHVGSYSEEAATIEHLHAWVAGQGYELRGRHHEIYLGDPSRTAPERLKTVLRHPVRPA